MARRTRYDLARVYAHLLEHPGIRAGKLARVAGMEGERSEDILVLLESNGYLTSEDANGLVYPFRWVAKEKSNGMIWEL